MNPMPLRPKMLQPAKKYFGIICCNRHTASTSGGIIFAIAAAAFLVHRIISELQQQQVVHVCVILYKWRPAGRKTRLEHSQETSMS